MQSPATFVVVASLALAAAACGGTTGEAATNGSADPGTRADGAGSVAHLPPGPPRRPAPAGDTGPRQPAGSGSQDVNLEGVGHDLGSRSATLRVVELMDYGCYYCRTFHLETFPSLRAEYVETGEVFWKVIPFVLGNFPNSPAAAVAAECAGRQGAFERMSGRLFERQREWSRADDAPALMREYARAEGLDAPAFDACMRDPDTADEIRRNSEISRLLGVRGTPTFFILGHSRVPGAVPLDFFRDLLDRALEERR